MRIGWFAPFYRWIEYIAFGRALEERRFALLPRVKDARRVLVLGEGDGRTTERLLQIAPGAQIDVIELSPEMIELAKDRTTGSDRVTFRCEDARDVELPASYYDAVITNFFLDCFSESDARRLIGKFAKALTPRGQWLIAEFAVPSEGWRRVHAWLWIRIMYFFFRVTTGLKPSALPPIERLMREAGLERFEHESRRAGLMISEAWRTSF